MLVIASLCLGGCGTIKTEQQNTTESSESVESVTTESSETTETVTTESSETVGITTESTVEPEVDVDGMLEAAEQAAAVLEKKLSEDASLKQSDMNILSGEIYVIWDDLLNELWGILKENLDQETMDKLLQEQRAWIVDKEAAVKEAGAQFAGGSMAPLAANQKAAELTKARVQVLAEYLKR
jgi:uncharacterized protein YecT (DUF1311 family)